jgi:ribosomal protein S6--L-glutamate ligase
MNAGPRTQRAFAEGASDIPVESLVSKKLLLHLDGVGGVSFLNKNVPVSFHDSYVLVRLRSTDAHFCGMLAEYLAHHAIPSNDPIHLAYPYSAEKISQMLKLSLAGIRIPETFIFREESFADNYAYLLEHITFPCVFKTDGSKGRSVTRCKNMEEVVSLIALKRPHRLALVQPFIENTFDTRTIVTFGNVLGSISRTRKEGYLNNIAQGADAALFNLSPQESDTAIRAAKACGIDVAGVDLIHTNDGPIVLEVNKSPQVRGFESVHGFKVFTRIAEILRTRHGV